MTRSTRLLTALLVLAGAPALAAPPAKKPAATKQAPPAEKKAPPEQKQPQARPVRGTHVSLVPPEGFVEATRFSGFQKNATGSSILVTELPAGFNTVSQAFEAGAMASKGMKLLEKEAVPLQSQGQGGKALLVHVEQESAGTAFRKWMLALGDDKGTALVTATFQKELEASESAPLKAAVLTARRDLSTEAPPVEPLFTLQQTPGLKRAHQVQNAVLYTPDGKLEGHAPEEPLLVVAPSIGDPGALDVKAFSEKRLRLTAGVMDVVVESGAPLEVDGMKGYELVARATDSKRGTPLVLHQVLLLEEGGYFILQGRMGTGRRQEYLPHFQAAARSLKRKP